MVIWTDSPEPCCQTKCIQYDYLCMASQIRSVVGPRQVLILTVGVILIVFGAFGLLGAFG